MISIYLFIIYIKTILVFIRLDTYIVMGRGLTWKMGGEGASMECFCKGAISILIIYFEIW